MLEELKDLDNSLLVALNGSDSIYWDSVMWIVTKTTTWIPFLIIVLYLVAKNSNWRRTVLVVAALALTVLLADQLSSGLIKPLVMRWRPTHDVTFLHTIDTVFGYTGGRYGFVSSHAANTFALFAFLSLLFRSSMASVCFFLWACLSSYSRIYLGVHFPGDICCGALLGLFVGGLVFWTYKRLLDRLVGEYTYTSPAYTSGGFLVSDMPLLLFALTGTCCIVLLAAIPLANPY